MEKDAQKRVAKTYKGPRVHIGVEVADGGATRKRELPFIVGVLAPLSGNAEVPVLEDREAVEIDRLNFDEVMTKISPRLDFGGSSMTFKTMKDFEPEQVANKIPDLEAKLRRRKALSELLMRLRANGKFGAEVRRVLEQVAQDHESPK